MACFSTQLIVQHEGKAGQELRAGQDLAAGTETDHRGKLLTSLCMPALLSFLLRYPGTTVQDKLGPSTSIIGQEDAPAGLPAG